LQGRVRKLVILGNTKEEDDQSCKKESNEWIANDSLTPQISKFSTSVLNNSKDWYYLRQEF
jgi:hypothetical protein